MEVKYNKIGIDYNQTRKADKYLADKLFYHLRPEKSKRYLDIGCGTGNYTDELYNRGVDIIGIDPSEIMLKAARSKNEKIEWRLGTADKTSLKNKSVDGITASLTIHHWKNLQDSFLEMNRVLKDNGRIVIFTSTPKQMDGYWLNHYFPKMLEDSKRQMPSFSEVGDAMNDAGIETIETEKYFVHPGLQDHFLYSGKTKPELYLKSEIREAISSFSDLANRQEVDKGLNQLKMDIEGGRIYENIKEYENDEGDYLYIIGIKIRNVDFRRHP